MNNVNLPKKEFESIDVDKYPTILIDIKDKIVYVSDKTKALFGSFTTNSIFCNYIFSNTQILYLINEISLHGDFFRDNFPIRKLSGMNMQSCVFGKRIGKEKNVYVLFFEFSKNVTPDIVNSFISYCDSANTKYYKLLAKLVRSRQCKSNVCSCYSGIVFNFDRIKNEYNYLDIFICNFISEYYSAKEISLMIKVEISYILFAVKKLLKHKYLVQPVQILNSVYDSKSIYSLNELFKFDMTIWKIIIFYN